MCSNYRACGWDQNWVVLFLIIDMDAGDFSVTENDNINWFSPEKSQPLDIILLLLSFLLPFFFFFFFFFLNFFF